MAGSSEGYEFDDQGYKKVSVIPPPNSNNPRIRKHSADLLKFAIQSKVSSALKLKPSNQVQDSSSLDSKNSSVKKSKSPFNHFKNKIPSKLTQHSIIVNHEAINRTPPLAPPSPNNHNNNSQTPSPQRLNAPYQFNGEEAKAAANNNNHQRCGILKKQINDNLTEFHRVTFSVPSQTQSLSSLNHLSSSSSPPPPSKLVPSISPVYSSNSSSSSSLASSASLIDINENLRIERSSAYSRQNRSVYHLINERERLMNEMSNILEKLKIVNREIEEELLKSQEGGGGGGGKIEIDQLANTIISKLTDLQIRNLRYKSYSFPYLNEIIPQPPHFKTGKFYSHLDIICLTDPPSFDHINDLNYNNDYQDIFPDNSQMDINFILSQLTLAKETPILFDSV